MSILPALCLAAALASPQTPPEQSPGERLHNLIAADRESSKLAPDKWPDLSRDGLRSRETQDRATLDALRRIPRAALAFEDRTTYDLFAWRLERRVEQFRLKLYLTPFWDDPRYGPGVLWGATTVRSLPPEYAARVRKLDAFPAYVAQITSLLQEAIDAHQLPSKALAREVATSLESIRQPWMQSFGPRRADATQVWADRVQASMRDRVSPALRELHDFVTTKYLPACPHFASLADWPNGAEVYQELIRRNTTTALDPKQIHDIGLAEVVRIRKAMSAVMSQAGFQGDLNAFLASMNTDQRFYATTEQELLDAYRAAVARIEPLLPKVIRTLPSQKLTVEAVRHDGPAAMYRDTDAVVVVDVTKLSVRPKFEILTLMLHEGVPGHHLQFALQRQLHPTEPDFYSTRQSVAFMEGWALYAETLGDEMGLYTDPYDKFGQLSWDLMRAVRLVVDTGIHHCGWSQARATQYFMDTTGKSKDMADLEVPRSIRPGISLAYKIGELRIRALRDRIARKLGTRFDVRSFHETLMRWGNLPLDILDRKAGECLEDPSCAASFQ